VATDASGAPVPAARVTLNNEETGVSTEALTNQSGTYLFPNLRPGTYKLTAAAPGFQSFETTPFEVVAYRTVRRDVPFQVAAAATEVTVTDVVGTMVQTESPAISTRLTQRQILELPTTLRSVQNQAGDSGLIFTFMPLTVPGVVQVNNGAAWLTPGAGANSVRVRVDGIDTNFGNFGGPDPVSQPSFEAIEEFSANILTNKAEFAGMGQITSVTRSGTNNYHGSIFWYAKNSALDARSAFTPTKTFNNIHNVGGTIGGPVWKDRTFFFATFDHTRGVRAYNFAPTVPSEAMRAGVFPTALRNPYTGENFVNNRIPAELLSQQALRTQQLFYPLPNVPGATGNYRAGLNGPEAHYLGEMRLDHHISSGHSVFGRYQFKQSDYTQPGSRSPLPTTGTSQNHRDVHFITVGDQASLSASLFNEFRAGLVTLNSESSSDMSGQDVLNQLGIEGLTGYETIQGIPSFNISGFSNTRVQLLNPVIDGRWQISDNLTWVTGRHTIKGGVELISAFVNRYLPVQEPRFGSFVFNGQYTGSPYADFLLGLPAQVSTLAPYPDQRNRYKDFNFYVQDDWKVTQRLTLSLGLRFEYNQPATPEDDNIFTFDPGTGAIVVPNENALRQFAGGFPSNLPVRTAAEVGLPESLRFADKNNWAPRVGFAYLLDDSATTVIRGGWGIYYGHFSGAVPAYLSAGPYSVATTAINPRTAPTFTLANPFATASSAGVLNLQGVVPNLLNARSMQYSLSVERQFRGDIAVRVSYIGSQGRQLPYIRDINQPFPSTERYSAARRPYPTFNQIGYVDNGANSTYNGLQVHAQKRFSRGLMFSSAWTWAKHLSEVDDTGNAELNTLIENAYDRARDRGDVTAVPRHQWINNVLYELPLGRGTWLGGWQVNALLNMSTGHWLNPVWTGVDPAGVGVASVRPDLVSELQYPSQEGQWYDRGAFAAPPIGRFGTAPRNLIRTPGYVLFNAGLLKGFRFEGGREIQFGVQFVNVLNHVNLGNPVTTVNVANAGQIAGSHIFPPAGSPRTGQLSFRYNF
jgi:hypothetical protein